MKSFHKTFSTCVNCLRMQVLLLGLVVVAVACNSDEELPSPKVFIEKPFENQTIFSVDTVLVKARIVAEAGLEWAEVELVDANLSPVTGKVRFTTSGTDVDFTAPLMLDAPLLASGTYHVAVRAYDGQKIGSGFKRVLLNGLPRAVEGLLVATRTSFNVRIWSSLNLTGPWEELFSKNIDCRGVALNYRHNVLAIAGGETGNLDFHELEEYNIINSVQGLGSLGLPYFFEVEFTPLLDEFMVLVRDPQLRLFNRYGLPQSGIPLLPDFLPTGAYAANEFYFVGERLLGQPNHSLNVYTRMGLRVLVMELGGAPVGVFARNGSQYFVWENAAGGAKLKLLDFDSQVLSNVFQREGEALKGVAQISNGNFVFLTSAGLYRYSYTTGATQVVAAGIHADRLYYETLSDTYFLAQGNTLSRVAPNGSVIGQYTFPAEVYWLGFNYNR